MMPRKKATTMNMESIFRKAERIFVSDFDGTMTDRDFYLSALAEMPEGSPDFWQQYLDGQLTVFEVLQSIFASIRGDEQHLMELARAGGLDPNLGNSTKQLDEAGWQVVVASIGCEWYIGRLLAERGVDVPIVANPGQLTEHAGLRMTQPVDSPFHSEAAGVNKAGIVQAAIATGATVAFAGDSRPDYEAAMLVPAELRFARNSLAEILDSESIPYRRYENWSQIASFLVGQPRATKRPS